MDEKPRSTLEMESRLNDMIAAILSVLENLRPGQSLAQTQCVIDVSRARLNAVLPPEFRREDCERQLPNPFTQADWERAGERYKRPCP